MPEVKLKIKLEGQGDVDQAAASVNRLNDAVNNNTGGSGSSVNVGQNSLDRMKAHGREQQQILQDEVRGYTEVRKQVLALQDAQRMSLSEETFSAKYKNELIGLLNTVRSGSISIEDYRQRLKLIPPSMQDAIAAAKRLENSHHALGDATQKGSFQLRSFITGLSQIEGAAGPAGRHLGMLERGLVGVGGALGPMGLLLGAAVAGFAVLVVGLAVVLDTAFKLAEAFAKYNNELEKTGRVTALSSKMIEGLKLIADEANVSFADVEASAGKFSQTIGKAAGGSVEASKALAAVGLSAKSAMGDVDSAFTKAISVISKMPEGLARSRVEFGLFGTDWIKIDDLIKASNGNIGAAVKRAQELGLSMGGNAAAGTREFNKAMAEAKVTVQGVENALGKEFLPTVSRALKDFTSWVVENKNSVKDWAKSFGEGIKGIVDALKNLIQFLRDHKNELVIAGKMAGGDYAGVAQAAASYAVTGSALPGGDTTGAPPTAASGGMSWQDLIGAAREKAEKEKQANAAILEAQRAADEETAKKDLAARIKIAADDAAQAKTEFEKLAKDAEDAFSGKNEFGIKTTSQAFQESMADSLAHYETWYKYRLDLLDKFENDSAAKENKTSVELDALHRDQEKRRQEYADTAVSIQRQMQVALSADRKKNDAEAFADAESRTHHEIEQIKLRASAELADITAKHVSGIGETGTYSQEEQRFLAYKQTIARDEITSQINKLTTLMGDPNADAKKKTDLQGQIDSLNQQLINLKQTQGRELTPDAQAIKDANDQLNRLHRQDRDEQYVADRQHLESKKQEFTLQQEIDFLNDQIKNVGINDALEIEASHLKDILEDRRSELNAVIAIQHAQFELSKSMDVSNTEVRAGLYQHMASQETLQQATINGWNKTYDAIQRVIDGPLDKLDQKTKGFLSFIIEPMKAVQNQAFTNIWHGVVDKVFGSDSALGQAMKSTGNPVLDEAQKQTGYLKTIADAVTGGSSVSGLNPTTGGGGLPGLLKIFGLGGSHYNANGPSGTPMFQGFGGSTSGGQQTNDPTLGGLIDPDTGGWANGTSAKQGGLAGMFGGMFGPKKNLLTGNDSKAAGMMSGIGSLATMVGGFLGDGKLGNTVRDAGMGAQIGANFGPWGAAIGAAAGAIFGLFSHGDDANKKLKEAAQAQYGINIKDGSVLNALKSLGEGMFGRGNVGKNAAAVVGSEQGRNIISAYAKSSGQSTLQIDRLNYGDPNWAGNDFRLDSGTGSGGSFTNYDLGSVKSSTPSMQTPQFAAAGNVMPPAIIAGLSESIYQLKDEVARLSAQPAGVIVRDGLAGNEDNVADAYHSSLDNNGYGPETLARRRGEYT